MPVNSHEFIALIAPRAVFIGGGALITDPAYAPGDAWQDAQGMFMAAADASPAWTILGAKGLGTDTFPPMLTLIDTGDVAFRQHQYGHSPAPDWPYFIGFAQKELQEVVTPFARFITEGLRPIPDPRVFSKRSRALMTLPEPALRMCISILNRPGSSMLTGCRWRTC